MFYYTAVFLKREYHRAIGHSSLHTYIRFCVTRKSNVQGRGGGGRGSNCPPIGFSDLKLKLCRNQNEVFSTSSPIMSTSFDVT